MKTVSISAPDETFDQTVEALCFTGGYNGDPLDGVAKLEFAKEQLVMMLGDRNRDYARSQIRQATAAAADLQITAALEQIAATRDTVIVTIA